MSRANKVDPHTADQALEALLQQASPRPVPSELAAARARREVQAEWRQVVARRRSTRRFVLLAAAASVALLAVVAFNTWMVSAPDAVQVASVARATGTIFVLGEKEEMLEASGLSSVVTGQTVRTDPGSALGLGWLRGGSLRLDENTEVTFLSADRIELAAGRVYFDSLETPDALRITTPYGDVQHVGTRYMVRADATELTLSVRDGRVDIVTPSSTATAYAGEQLRINDSRQRPQRLNVSVFGPEWAWVEASAPVPVLQGKSIYELLQWVSRETGLQFDFEDRKTEELVRTETVDGVTRSSPRAALRQALLIANLHSNMDEVGVAKSGVILIRK